jgi:hypothetical protein
VEDDVDEQALRDAPIRRVLQAIVARQEAAIAAMDSPASHVPSRMQPRAFCATWGPLGLQTARRVGAVGFEGKASLVDPATYLTPNFPALVNMLVGQFGPFLWSSFNMFANISWTYRAVPVPFSSVPVNPLPAARLFEPAISANGGGMVLDNFAGRQPGLSAAFETPRVSVDIDLYDKKRGRSITSGRMPAETFVGGTYGDKLLGEPCVFEHGTELEPRLYVNEIAMGSALNTNQLYDPASVAAWVHLVIRGHTVLP